MIKVGQYVIDSDTLYIFEGIELYIIEFWASRLENSIFFFIEDGE